MNSVALLGRITKDLELKTGGAKNTSFGRFNLAVNRNYKNADGKYDADFINCLAFGKTAETIAKYFKKGSQIAVNGHIQTGNYTNKDGQKVYTTDVIIDNFDFVGSSSEKNGGEPVRTIEPGELSQSQGQEDDFMKIPDGIDEELPFA